MKEKDLLKCMTPAACVPRVICTTADHTHAGILLDTCLACSLSSILHSPFDEASARFCAASVVTALEDLHKVLYLQFKSVYTKGGFKNSFLYFFIFFNFLHPFQNGILYRGVSAEVLMLDQTGHIKVSIMLFLLPYQLLVSCFKSVKQLLMSHCYFWQSVYGT